MCGATIFCSPNDDKRVDMTTQQKTCTQKNKTEKKTNVDGPGQCVAQAFFVRRTVKNALRDGERPMRDASRAKVSGGDILVARIIARTLIGRNANTFCV